MRSIKTSRALGLLLDYILWYVLMYVMILVYFFVIERHTAFSDNLTGYAEIFSSIMKTPSFLLIYFAGLVTYEILIPLCFGGQSLSKKILKIEMEPFTFTGVLVRGFLKLIIINPCGVVSYIVATMMAGSAAIISDGLWIVLLLDGVLVLMNKRALHDMLTKTTIREKSEGRSS